jgi:hypothetical protein
MKLKYIISILIAGLLVLSCDEEGLDKTNPNGFTTSSYYQNKGHLEKATNAIYGQFTGSIYLPVVRMNMHQEDLSWKFITPS